MKKRILSLILALCAMLALLTACDTEEESEPISAPQAVQIVLDELDMTIEEVNPHAHTGVYEGAECYIIYVTVNGRNMAYTIHSMTGEILKVEESGHTH